MLETGGVIAQWGLWGTRKLMGAAADKSDGHVVNGMGGLVPRDKRADGMPSPHVQGAGLLGTGYRSCHQFHPCIKSINTVPWCWGPTKSSGSCP